MKIHEKFERTLTNILAEAYQKIPKVGSLPKITKSRVPEALGDGRVGRLGGSWERSWAVLGRLGGQGGFMSEKVGTLVLRWPPTGTPKSEVAFHRDPKIISFAFKHENM